MTYALGIYNLNLLLGFLTPQVDPELEGPTLPSKKEDEFRPFVRRLPEFKFWCAAPAAAPLGRPVVPCAASCAHANDECMPCLAAAWHKGVEGMQQDDVDGRAAALTCMASRVSMSRNRIPMGCAGSLPALRPWASLRQVQVQM